MLKVKHITLEPNVEQKITFDVKASEFLIKNFTSEYVQVSINKPIETDDYIKVPSEHAEIIALNEGRVFDDVFKTDTVYLKGAVAGEVEVRCLKW